MKLLSTVLFITLTTSVYSKIDSKTVATVNGQKITIQELEKAFKQNKMFVNDNVVTVKGVLDNLINRQIGIQKARKANLDENPIVKEKMEDVLFHAQISKDLEEELKKVKVSDQEVKRYYKSNPEIRTAHILLRVRAESSKEEENAAQQTALKILDQLKEDRDRFAELANKYSQTAAAPVGGDIGFQPAVRLAPEYYEAIKGKPVGHISGLVRTDYGYHIIKVLGVKKEKDIQKDLYKKILFDAKRDKLMASYFNGLRKSAKIVVNKDLLKEDLFN